MSPAKAELPQGYQGGVFFFSFFWDYLMILRAAIEFFHLWIYTELPEQQNIHQLSCPARTELPCSSHLLAARATLPHHQPLQLLQFPSRWFPKVNRHLLNAARSFSRLITLRACAGRHTERGERRKILPCYYNTTCNKYC